MQECFLEGEKERESMYACVLVWHSDVKSSWSSFVGFEVDGWMQFWVGWEERGGALKGVF